MFDFQHFLLWALGPHTASGSLFHCSHLNLKIYAIPKFLYGEPFYVDWINFTIGINTSSPPKFFTLATARDCHNRTPWDHHCSWCTSPGHWRPPQLQWRCCHCPHCWTNGIWCRTCLLRTLMRISVPLHVMRTFFPCAWWHCCKWRWISCHHLLLCLCSWGSVGSWWMCWMSVPCLT